MKSVLRQISEDFKALLSNKLFRTTAKAEMNPFNFLRSHGLPAPKLHEEARTTTVASLMYASPSWWGFTTARGRDLMKRMINKLKRSGFFQCLLSLPPP